MLARAGAISSGGERFPDTEEVRGSNPLSPTSTPERQARFRGRLTYPQPSAGAQLGAHGDHSALPGTQRSALMGSHRPVGSARIGVRARASLGCSWSSPTLTRASRPPCVASWPAPAGKGAESISTATSSARRQGPRGDGHRHHPHDLRPTRRRRRPRPAARGRRHARRPLRQVTDALLDAEVDLPAFTAFPNPTGDGSGAPTRSNASTRS